MSVGPGKNEFPARGGQVTMQLGLDIIMSLGGHGSNLSHRRTGIFKVWPMQTQREENIM